MRPPHSIALYLLLIFAVCATSCNGGGGSGSGGGLGSGGGSGSGGNNGGSGSNVSFTTPLERAGSLLPTNQLIGGTMDLKSNAGIAEVRLFDTGEITVFSSTESGAHKWSATIHGLPQGYPEDWASVDMDDNGNIVCTFSYNLGSSWATYLAQFNSSGQLTMSTQLNTPAWHVGEAICLTPTGFLLGIEIDSEMGCDLVMLNANGDFTEAVAWDLGLWDDPAITPYGSDYIISSDDGLLCVDEQGNGLWRYGSDLDHDSAEMYLLDFDDDGHLLFQWDSQAGDTSSYGKLSTSGQLLWAHTISTSLFEHSPELRGGAFTSTGDIALCGWVYDWNGTDPDKYIPFVLSTDSTGANQILMPTNRTYCPLRLAQTSDGIAAWGVAQDRDNIVLLSFDSSLQVINGCSSFYNASAIPYSITPTSFPNLVFEQNPPSHNVSGYSTQPANLSASTGPIMPTQNYCP